MAIAQALHPDALWQAPADVPHRLPAQSRRADPVLWLVTRHDDLPQDRLLRDPPKHGRLRRAVSREFTPRRIEALRPRVEQLTERLLAEIAPRGQAELIEDFAVPLAITIVMELLGVPRVDQENFRYWADLVTGVRGRHEDEVPSAHAEAGGYLADLIRHKARTTDDVASTDLLSALARSDDGDRLPERELTSLAFLLLVAGCTTTIDLIGNGMRALLHDPDRLGLLRAKPELIGAALEEFLRSGRRTSHATLQFAEEGLAIGGVEIPAGDPVVLSPAAAHGGHLAFGRDVHHSIGAPLARLEGEIAFSALLGRCRDLAPVTTAADLTWRIGLPVTFRPIT
jgi:cytochrome P450